MFVTPGFIVTDKFATACNNTTTRIKLPRKASVANGLAGGTVTFQTRADDHRRPGERAIPQQPADSGPLAALRALFSPHQIIVQPEEIAGWSATTHPLRALPRAIVFPHGRAEIIAAVRALAGSGWSISAIGRGMNIGLGARNNTDVADVVLDLGHNRAILAYDRSFGVIDIEPGVSFADAFHFLREQKSRFFIPPIGGPRDASVVGNLLQRGEGTGPGGDRVDALLELEAVTASGEVVTAGRGVTDRPGPDLTGLFLQSRAGIVTRVKLALTPFPPGLMEFALRLDDGAALEPAFDALRQAHLRNIVVPGALSIWNGTKLAASDRQSHSPDEWFIVGNLHVASRARAEADWSDLLCCLRDGEARLTPLGCNLEMPVTGAGIFQGEPLEQSMPLVRSCVTDPTAPHAAPGFAWLCPALPFDRGAVTAIEMIRRALESAGMPPAIALTPRNHRTLRGFIALAWDRADAMAEARAIECHDSLLETLAAAGFPPFRLGHLSGGWSAAFADQTRDVTDRVLRALAGDAG